MRLQLEKAALKLVAGLELTNANYKAVINVLKEWYGNNQFIVDTHYINLMDMPPTSNKTTSLPAMYDAIEQLLRLFHSKREYINKDRWSQ